MSTLTALARAHAATAGRAQPITTVRHVHVDERPMVLVPLAMAGEANAPLAAMVGVERDSPALLVVAQPRDRVLRFGFAEAMAAIVLPHFDGCAARADAPQIWVPNAGGIDFLRLLGRSTRFRQSTGPHAAPPTVPTLGMWLTFLAERAQHPGSSILCATTTVLAQHWATGQSSVEDGNLAALLGWIEPPAAVSGAQAALAAEDPLLWPPAGPATDPTFDREVLAPGIAAYDIAADGTERGRAVTRLEAALRGQLLPTWELVWQGIDRLRAHPVGGHVARRWDRDTRAFDGFYDRVRDGGVPQAKQDSAVAAAKRLNMFEGLQADYDAQRAYDDPLVMAEYRLTGDAFVGVVVAADPTRLVGSGARPKLRPTITIETADAFRLTAADAKALTYQAEPSVQADIHDIDPTPGGLRITLEVTKGMGRGKAAEPGTVPEVGDRVCFGAVARSFRAKSTYPEWEDTPWTHGGPPTPPTPTAEDATEEWA